MRNYREFKGYRTRVGFDHKLGVFIDVKDTDTDFKCNDRRLDSASTELSDKIRLGNEIRPKMRSGGLNFLALYT